MFKFHTVSHVHSFCAKDAQELAAKIKTFTPTKVCTVLFGFCIKWLNRPFCKDNGRTIWLDKVPDLNVFFRNPEPFTTPYELDGVVVISQNGNSIEFTANGNIYSRPLLRGYNRVYFMFNNKEYDLTI